MDRSILWKQCLTVEEVVSTRCSHGGNNCVRVHLSHRRSLALRAVTWQDSKPMVDSSSPPLSPAVHVKEDQEHPVGRKVEGCVRCNLVFTASHSSPSLVCFLLQVHCCPSFPLRSLPPLLGGGFSHFLFFWILLAFVFRFKKRPSRWTRKILRYGELSQPEGGGQGRIARMGRTPLGCRQERVGWLASLFLSSGTASCWVHSWQILIHVPGTHI